MLKAKQTGKPPTTTTITSTTFRRRFNECFGHVLAPMLVKQQQLVFPSSMGTHPKFDGTNDDELYCIHSMRSMSASYIKRLRFKKRFRSGD